MSFVNSFVLVWQQLSGVMTGPTWNNFQRLMIGWAFARRRTVTGMIEAAGQIGKRHHSVFHRVFAKARWSLDGLGLAVFDLVWPFCGETVFPAIDDTLANKRGLKVFGTGMHYDPMLSSRGLVAKASSSNLPANCDLTSRLVWNARLHAAPGERTPSAKGRPRKRGERLPSPEQMLKQRGRRIHHGLVRPFDTHASGGCRGPRVPGPRPGAAQPQVD